MIAASGSSYRESFTAIRMTRSAQTALTSVGTMVSGAREGGRIAQVLFFGSPIPWRRR